ncbi:MAG: hypothetical protein ACHQQ3_12140 [Gemmatimonadales bacterium]
MQLPTGQSGTLIVPLHSRRRRRARAVQRLQDVIPAGALLIAGVQGLVAGASGAALALALTEIVTTALLLTSIMRTIREARSSAPPPPHSGDISWGEIWAASVLMAEWWERWHEGHHRSRPTLLLAAVTLLVGLFHGRVTRAVQRRRALTLTDDSFSVGGRRLWSRFRSSWDELATISITPTEARVRTLSDKVWKIDLADLENADEVRSALEVARKRLTEDKTGPH